MFKAEIANSGPSIFDQQVPRVACPPVPWASTQALVDKPPVALKPSVQD